MKYLILTMLIFCGVLSAENIFFEGFENENLTENWIISGAKTSTTRKSEGKNSLAISSITDTIFSKNFSSIKKIEFKVCGTNDVVKLVLKTGAEQAGIFQEISTESINLEKSFTLIEREFSNPEIRSVFFQKTEKGIINIDEIKIYYKALNNPITEKINFTQVFINNPFTIYKIKNLVNSGKPLTFKEISFDLTQKTTLSETLESSAEFELYYSLKEDFDLTAQLLSRAKIENKKINFLLQKDFICSENGKLFLRATFTVASISDIVENHTFQIKMNDQSEHKIWQECKESDIINLQKPHYFFDDFGSMSLNENNWILFPSKEHFSIVEAPIPVSTGSIWSENKKLLCTHTNGALLAAQPSKTAFGKWSFYFADGDGWNTTSANNYAAILLCDLPQINAEALGQTGTAMSHNFLGKNSSVSFNGYYLVNDKQLKFYKRQGKKIEELATFSVIFNSNGLPINDTDTKNSGYKVEIERTLLGIWKIKINDIEFPQIIDNTDIRESNYFAFFAHLSSGEFTKDFKKRRLYIDDVKIAELAPEIVKKKFPQIKLDLTENFLNWQHNTDFNVEIASYDIFSYKLNQKSWEFYDNISSAENFYQYDLTGNLEKKGIFWRIIAKDVNEKPLHYREIKSTANSLLIRQGWNLIGCSGDKNLLAEIKRNFMPNTTWLWQNNIYIPSHCFNENDGFWIYSEEEKIIKFSPEIDPSLDLHEWNIGWNLVSFNEKNLLLANDKNIFIEIDNRYHEITESEIQSFNGYWISNF